MFLNFQLIVN